MYGYVIVTSLYVYLMKNEKNLISHSITVDIALLTFLAEYTRGNRKQCINTANNII